MSLIFEWTNQICYHKFSQVTTACDFLLVQGLHISHVSLTCGDVRCKLLPFRIRSIAKNIFSPEKIQGCRSLFFSFCENNIQF